MYLILFEDGTKYKGGDLYDSGWNSMPEKKISQLIYKFPNKTIVIKGYDLYNHLIDQVYVGGMCKFQKIHLMGLKDNQVTAFTYSFSDNTLRKLEHRFGEEHEGKPSLGWKSGNIEKRSKILT